MPKRLDLESNPRCYLASGTWPDGPLVKKHPPEAVLAKHISTTFRNVCKFRGLSTRQAAAVVKISQKAVHNLLNGRSWPDLTTIARVEGNLGIQLWTSQYNAGSDEPLELQPRRYLVKGAVWPDGPLVKDAPPEAVLAQHISTEFRKTFKARNLTVGQAADKASISEAAVYNLLNGDTWFDLPTIARVERKFRLRLWLGQQNVKRPD